MILTGFAVSPQTGECNALPADLCNVLRRVMKADIVRARTLLKGYSHLKEVPLPNLHCIRH